MKSENEDIVSLRTDLRAIQIKLAALEALVAGRPDLRLEYELHLREAEMQVLGYKSDGNEIVN